MDDPAMKYKNDTKHKIRNNLVYAYSYSFQAKVAA